MPISRERVQTALKHQTPDRVPLDLGGGSVTGIHASVVYQLRQALKLDSPGVPVKVIDPFLMLGEVQPDLIQALGIDVIRLASNMNRFGFKNEGWKPWTLFDGTPVLVPEKFTTTPQPDGSILLYPEGDISAPPSGIMPKGGFYFDIIVRQEPFDESKLDYRDNLEEFGPISPETLTYYQQEAERLFTQTDKAIMAGFGGTSFGDIAQVPAPWLKHPKGIRALEEWYMSMASRPEYVQKIFERQCEIGLANLEKIYQAVGDRVTAVNVTGADFGTQRAPLISPRVYRRLFKPFHKQINDWIHQHTTWKTFIHSCGSVRAFISDFIEAGFDILNPVQISAAGMEPGELKREFGDQITFWGGGVDTQHTLPYGTPEQVKAEVHRNVQIFSQNGGFIFTPVHNIQPQVPVKNVFAMLEALRE